MPARNFIIIVLVAAFSLVCYETSGRNRYATTVAEAMRLIEEEYVEPVEPRMLFESAMEGLVGRLDQYSQYFGPEPFRQIAESLEQKFGGVGIVVEKTGEDEPLMVLSPIFGTPAYRAGLLAGDQVLTIDGESTKGMKVSDAIHKMRGLPGSTVVLSVLRAGETEPAEFKIVRGEIPIESVLGDTRRADGSWDYRLDCDRRIAYLRLTTFGKQSVEEIQRVLHEAPPMDPPYEALLIDLRGNAGGLLSAAVEICDLFLDQGRIVSTRGRGGDEREIYDASPPAVVGAAVPVAILVNRYSASASEIVAACLQDHDRAVVVGERTWGKGTVQNLFELESGRSALKITTASYWRPNGANIHRRKDAGEDDEWGVRPNEGFAIAVTDEQFEEILKTRQQRDLPFEAHAPGPSASGPNGTDETRATSSPAVDPQFEKAVEYLRQKLLERTAPRQG